MRNQSKTFQRACDVLRSRVRFEPVYGHIHLRLPGRETVGANDTVLIQRATRLYVETWIIPIIDAMQKGSAADIKELL